MEHLISVIIPIYNMEKYLDRCLCSVLGQSYSNLEVILVDDGSTDGSADMCDRYAKLDRRIRVIHQENGGLSDARNTGFEAASGDLIAFLDSDDFIAKEAFKVLLDHLVAYDADLSVCNIQKFKIDEHPAEKAAQEEIRVFSNTEALQNLFNPAFSLQMVVSWNKLYKKSLFENIRFPKGKVHEDEYTTYRLLYRSARIVYSSRRLYYYLQRPDSITGEKFNLTRLHRIEAFAERTEFFKEKNLKELYLTSGYDCAKWFAEYYLLIAKEYPEYRPVLRDLKRRYHAFYHQFDGKRQLPVRSRLILRLFYTSPALYRAVFDRYCRAFADQQPVSPEIKEKSL